MPVFSNATTLQDNKPHIAPGCECAEHSTGNMHAHRTNKAYVCAGVQQVGRVANMMWTSLRGAAAVVLACIVSSSSAATTDTCLQGRRTLALKKVHCRDVHIHISTEGDHTCMHSRHNTTET